MKISTNPWSSQIFKFWLWTGSIAYDVILIKLNEDYVVLLISMVNCAIILWIVGDIKEWWCCLFEEGKST